MNDADRALSELTEIRSRMAAATAFKGFGPTALALTGLVALMATLGQSLWLPRPASPTPYFAVWIFAALLSAGIIAAEMVGRSRRHHSDLADAMIQNAVATFLPFGAAGAALLLVLARFSPESLWLVPGLWQVLVGLGIFASARSLPAAVNIAGAWYFLAGLVAIMFAAPTHELSPWGMGLPFIVGQFLVAAIVHLSTGQKNEAA